MKVGRTPTPEPHAKPNSGCGHLRLPGLLGRATALSSRSPGLRPGLGRLGFSGTLPIIPSVMLRASRDLKARLSQLEIRSRGSNWGLRPGPGPSRLQGLITQPDYPATRVAPFRVTGKLWRGRRPARNPQKSRPASALEATCRKCAGRRGGVPPACAELRLVLLAGSLAPSYISGFLRINILTRVRQNAKMKCRPNLLQG